MASTPSERPEQQLQPCAETTGVPCLECGECERRRIVGVIDDWLARGCYAPDQYGVCDAESALRDIRGEIVGD